MAFQISLTSTSSIFKFEYSEGIPLDGPYEICLKSFVTYNNIPNISEYNNRIDFFTADLTQIDIQSLDKNVADGVSIPVTSSKGTYEIINFTSHIEKNPSIKLTIPKGT